jgi:D-alanyl-D-alanine carboxypeptidase
MRNDRPTAVKPVVLGWGPEAPVAAGQPVGTAVYRSGNRAVARVQVAAAEPVAALPWWRRLWRQLTAFLAA